MASPPRDWQVLLIGGASGVGKTHLSRALARLFQVNLVEVDDVQVVLERVTTPDTHPLLHFWRTNWPEYSAWPEREQLEDFVRVAWEFFSPALEGMVGHHLEAGTDIVLEGDFLLPQLATLSEYDGEANGGRVRAVFIYEEDEAQIAANYLQREGEAQPERARASWLYSEWLRAECARLDIPTLPARPWNTAVERALAAVASMSAASADPAASPVNTPSLPSTLP